MGSSKFRKLWIGIGVLILLSPLGLVLPRMFRAGGAWGEWGLDGINERAGYVPEGLKGLSGIWSAPVSDYAFSGWNKGLKGYLAYILSGIVGVALVAGLAYVLGRVLKRNE